MIPEKIATKIKAIRLAIDIKNNCLPLKVIPPN